MFAIFDFKVHFQIGDFEEDFLPSVTAFITVPPPV